MREFAPLDPPNALLVLVLGCERGGYALNYCTDSLSHCCESRQIITELTKPTAMRMCLLNRAGRDGKFARCGLLSQPQATATSTLMISRTPHDQLTYPPSLTSFMRLLPFLGLLFPLFSVSAAYSPVPRSVPYFWRSIALSLSTLQMGTSHRSHQRCPFRVRR